MQFKFIQLLLAASAMASAPRDAIHVDDVARYDTFMEGLDGGHYLNMHLDNGVVKIDVLDQSTNEKSHSEEFKPSSGAGEYFANEASMAAEVFGAGFQESALEGRACKRDEQPSKRALDALTKRRSRCYQFCGSIAHCRGNNGCPHCYAVRRGCLWQKLCR